MQRASGIWNGGRHESVAVGSDPFTEGRNGTGHAEESLFESLPEERLTELAREGDRLAFGELVRRNRANMYSWARSLTQDHHMAEDVVQEALVNAFLHVGRLAEESRFTPWLVRIVRNQAYMKLRRGGPFAKERPFSGLVPGAGWSYGAAGRPQSALSEGSADDWRDIDRVLFHLARHSEHEARQSRDPASALMRKELMEGIRQLLACLSAREKDIFEAHFFRHVTPREIAIVLDTSVANVYNSISRARGKMQRERLRLHVSMYVKQRRNAGKPKSKLLAPPILYQPKEC
ncbi:sigma-70 family RNA polymerase sigma factor [Paenibacillus hemerocallicola]|uniref:RNA polymerase sigma factor n=1 Tax=Paenibacillus hemerocallicola TaxID=1172614 RepID=A0A5C4SWG3_9BACL|nr:sigma-70 family RNA polymerase sigma factor [Paenibacillus hemerocallicola]TNJ59288.1 sigma-70 family RNA polymerase sigma factor [Paenibacillus hemerocallicola]